ncbi:MAG: SAM-dependent methyltransferase [Spirochaetaceae bacterium]|nr:SAM-dependent methyltransferase [Spirochaetaceae bacterium]
MAFLLQSDDVLTAVMSKPTGNTTSSCGVPNGAVRAKVKIRKSGEIYRTETTAGTQVFHGKLDRTELEDFFAANIPSAFKNAVIETTTETITILANKKGKCTVLRKKKNALPDSKLGNAPLSSAEMLAAGRAMHLSQPHDRQKNYLLKEGTPVNFLVRLGIMTKDGKVHAQKYSKFRQINRFLEYVDDILPELVARAESQESSALKIVDFGCGKSYLTFAVYYYLTAIKGLKAHITGIDLKKDVILHCKQLASDCGYKGMEFICGDVADFKGDEHPDLVITLHACDTATDYALSYAVKNEAKCILSVPCCQHELNSLLKKRVPDDAFSAMFKYGIIKERLSALATDVMRAGILEKCGYSTQILEFIDMEDTPKNLLIRAIKRETHAKTGENAHQSAQNTTETTGLDALKSALGQTITLENLLQQ